MNEPSKSQEIPSETEDFNDWEDYVFDTSFFEDISMDYGGGIGIFKLDHKEKSVYLHIYNDHNGYYAHGFEMKIDGNILHEGSL